MYKLLIFLLIIGTLKAQTVEKKPRNWMLKGYVKDLRTFIPADGVDSIVVDNLLHHRLNFKWYTSKSITTVIEMRNRLFYGEVVRNTPGFGKLIDQQSDMIDMSMTVIDERSLVLHTAIDRANIKWSGKKTDITLGRQRINWGINLVWNPNDIFNNFSWFDFDYEERAGSDALRVQHYTGYASSTELTLELVDDLEELTAAALWKFNQHQYDFQLMGGVAEKDAVIGGGWAGNISKAGFKGECAYFHPYEYVEDTTGIFTMSLSVDYSFKNGLYLNTSALYNGNGVTHAHISDLLLSEITAKNLFPYEFAYFGQVTGPITPLFNSGLGVIYSPGDNLLFLSPTFTFSLKDNWDLDIISQVFFSDMNGPFVTMGQYFFTRLKWSY